MSVRESPLAWYRIASAVAGIVNGYISEKRIDYLKISYFEVDSRGVPNKTKGWFKLQWFLTSDLF